MHDAHEYTLIRGPHRCTAYSRRSTFCRRGAPVGTLWRRRRGRGRPRRPMTARRCRRAWWSRRTDRGSWRPPHPREVSALRRPAVEVDCREPDQDDRRAGDSRKEGGDHARILRPMTSSASTPRTMTTIIAQTPVSPGLMREPQAGARSSPGIRAPTGWCSAPSRTGRCRRALPTASGIAPRSCRPRFTRLRCVHGIDTGGAEAP